MFSVYYEAGTLGCMFALKLTSKLVYDSESIWASFLSHRPIRRLLSHFHIQSRYEDLNLMSILLSFQYPNRPSQASTPNTNTDIESGVSLEMITAFPIKICTYKVANMWSHKNDVIWFSRTETGVLFSKGVDESWNFRLFLSPDVSSVIWSGLLN